MREVPDERSPGGERLNSVFFLRVDPPQAGKSCSWGPDRRTHSWRAIQQAHFAAGVPQSIRVEGWRTCLPGGYARCTKEEVRFTWGCRSAAPGIFCTRSRRFLWVWAGTVFLGFLISYLSTRRTLLRVERITETVARIGSEGLDERLPEPTEFRRNLPAGEDVQPHAGRIQASVKQLRSVTDAVAHDLKSPVTSVRGTLESALSAENGDQWRDSVAQAIEGLDRISALTQYDAGCRRSQSRSPSDGAGGGGPFRSCDSIGSSVPAGHGRQAS